jgi:pimeloyl-ACP methyl ester carboxylesterase
MMLVHGDVSAGSMVHPEDARRLAQMLTGLRIARIPGVGHNVHRDAREAFVATVVPFLLGH